MTPEQLKRWNESRKKRYAEDAEYREKQKAQSRRSMAGRYVRKADREADRTVEAEKIA